MAAYGDSLGRESSQERSADSAADLAQLRTAARRGKNTVWQRFLANRLALFGLAAIVVLMLFVALSPLLLLFDPDAIDYYNILQSPGSAPHWLGTDDLGRDVLARLAAGGRVSLAVGLSVSLVATILGALLGAFAGFYRAKVDMLISRIIDVLMSVPLLALLMVLSGVTKVGPTELVVLMALTGWMGVARLVRGQVLSLRETEFVLAARCLGASGSRIVFRHLLPNVVAPVTVAATLAVAATILIESALSYLGFGVRPPTATWGNMLQGAQIYMRTAPWLAVLPGVMIALTVVSFNFLGDGLREAIDPKLKNKGS